MEGGENVVKTAVDSYGRLDVLVNSAGITRDRMIFQMTPEDFDLIIRNNGKATFATCKYAAIVFRQQRSGRIVNMTSDAGLGEIGRSNFAAASEGIVGVTRTVARDLGRYWRNLQRHLPHGRDQAVPGYGRRVPSRAGRTPRRARGHRPVPAARRLAGSRISRRPRQRRAARGLPVHLRRTAYQRLHFRPFAAAASICTRTPQ